MEWSQFSTEMLSVNNSIINRSNWDKISEGMVKNSYLEQNETLFER